MPSTYKPIACWAIHVAAELASIPESLRKLLPGQDGTVSQEVRNEVGESQDWLCMYCGVDLRTVGCTFNIDHMRPTSRGGPSIRINLQALCEPCNKRKSDKTDGECRRIYGDVMPVSSWCERFRPPRYVIDQQEFKDAMAEKDQLDWQFGPRHALHDTATLVVLCFHSSENATKAAVDGIRDIGNALGGHKGKIRNIMHGIGA